MTKLNVGCGWRNFGEEWTHIDGGDYEHLDHKDIFLNEQEGKITLDQILGPLYGKMQMDDQTIYHKTVYDYASLSKLLTDCGFRDVAEYEWRETDHADHDDHSQAYIPHMDKDNGVLISLNVEAKK
mgnify:CR=1 FL=1